MSHVKSYALEIEMAQFQNGAESRSHMDQFGSHLDRRFTNSKMPIL